MKAVILAGGQGTRISEETAGKPKPMIEIGAKPLLWHIMKLYSHHGIEEFVVCLGYRGYLIKEYFANYYLHMGDVTFDLESNRMEVHNSGAEPSATTSSASRMATAWPTWTCRRCSSSTASTAGSRRSPRCSPRAASARSTSRAT
jgi:glucose-1-phosphate cytidylyltransferase